MHYTQAKYLSCATYNNLYAYFRSKTANRNGEERTSGHTRIDVLNYS